MGKRQAIVGQALESRSTVKQLAPLVNRVLCVGRHQPHGEHPPCPGTGRTGLHQANCHGDRGLPGFQIRHPGIRQSRSMGWPQADQLHAL